MILIGVPKTADKTIRGEMMKNITLAVILCILVNFSAGASMVSFYVVETGLCESSQQIRHAEVWENALLDVFFEAGHIVSNAPILRLDSRPEGDILGNVAFDILDGRTIGIDYILIAMLDYTGNLQSPGEISFYIYRVNPREQLLERKIPGKAYGTSREEYDDVKAIARGLIPYIEG